MGQAGNPVSQILVDGVRRHLSLERLGRFDPELLHVLDQSELQQVQTLEAAIQLLGQDERQVLQFPLGVGNIIGPQRDDEPRGGNGQDKPDGEPAGQQQAPGASAPDQRRQRGNAG